MNDLSLSSELPTLAKDVIDSEPVTGLRLNASKCEIISEDFNLIESFEVFKDFARVTKEEMTLLEAPILKGPALDRALQIKVDDLTRAVDRLRLVHAHDALVLFEEQPKHAETVIQP